MAIDTVLGYLAPFKEEGLEMREFSPGGGFAIGYVRGPASARNRGLRGGDYVGFQEAVRGPRVRGAVAVR